MLASTQISDKSHSWLAYSSPLAVHWDLCKSYNADVTFDFCSIRGSIIGFWAMKSLLSESPRKSTL